MSNNVIPEKKTVRRIRLAYLTSCRELGISGAEKVGRDIYDAESKDHLGYREGTLESLANTLNQNKYLSRLFEIDLVIFDDTKKEYEKEWSHHSLWPKHLKTNNGRTLAELSRRVPSAWRRLTDKSEKSSSKGAYEKKIMALLEKNHIDLVIVDSYRCIIGPILLKKFKGRIINIHPGVLNHKSASTPGAFPTRDSITRAKYGYIITDDKKISGKQKGRKITVVYKGTERTGVKVSKVSISGVTIHVVNKKIDAGPLIMERVFRYNVSEMTEEKLRQKNYSIKNKLLPYALIKYVSENKSLFGID